MNLWIDLMGWMGAIFFLVSYGLLVTKKWQSDEIRYHLANIAGAALLGIDTWHDASYPSFIINGFWGGIAFYGLIKDIQKLKRANLNS